MDGILIIDKPAGMTSHDVVARIRRILGTRRVGHTGTLDPFATGVMVILVGRATRLAQFLDKDVKEYIAEIQFGSETDTGDLEGLRIADCGLRNEEIAAKLARTDWEAVLSQFRGEIMQTPPMYSAKKVEGKKLYELAREGKEIERQSVKVSIKNLEILPDELRNPQSAIRNRPSTIRIRVACSAGTYIRTLAVNIGREVGVGAHLIDLRRTAAGKFGLAQSITLENLASQPVPEKALLPSDLAVSHLSEFRIPDERISATRDGLATRLDGSEPAAGQFLRMTAGDGSLVAVGVYDEAEKSIRPKVVLI